MHTFKDLKSRLERDSTLYLIGDECVEMLELLIELRDRTNSRRLFNAATVLINRMCKPTEPMNLIPEYPNHER